jgi:hypothetical protein
MHIIEQKYGNDGYATWFKLLEELGKANHHYIDISDEMNLMFLISVFKIDREKGMEILSDLAKLGAIDKFLFEEKQIIYSPKFIESIRDAYRKRKSDLLEYSALLDKIGIKNTQTGGRLAEETKEKAEVIPKEKKSKEEKRKEKERETRALDFLKNNFQSRFETDFLMKYKSKIENPKKFAEDFNDTVDQEKLDFDDKVLFGRLGKYARNWIDNQNKYSKTPSPDSYESGKQKRV